MIILEKYKSGSLLNGGGYKYFVPTVINDQWQWQDGQLNTLLEKASIRLGELNSYARLVPNIDLFIQLHVKKEAVVSSRIEGTQTNIQEAVLPVEEIAPERRNDWKEVQNYTESLNAAIGNLEQLPLSSRLLKKTHEILLSGVRGEHKRPGEYRTSQNWIGGSGPSNAVFVPPAHHLVGELMGDMENFLHNDRINVPALIRIGIAHYQFETIHPFLDGNGRIGRLLITLFLVDQNILHLPLLYLSVYFEKNRSKYYDNLTRVREQSDMLNWLKYFLTGIEQTSKEAVLKLTEIIELKKTLEAAIHKSWGRRTQHALVLLKYLFNEPTISVKKAEQVCALSKKAAGDLIDSFVEHKILNELTGQSRNRVFIFNAYIDLFNA